jgi:hypothetical protein
MKKHFTPVKASTCLRFPKFHALILPVLSFLVCTFSLILSLPRVIIKLILLIQPCDFLFNTEANKA